MTGMFVRRRSLSDTALFYCDKYCVVLYARASEFEGFVVTRYLNIRPKINVTDNFLRRTKLLLETEYRQRYDGTAQRLVL